MSDFHDLDWLFERSKRFPLLPEEEVIYHARIIQRHNRTTEPSRRLKELYQKSKKILIEHNIRLVAAAVRKYSAMATPAHGLGDMAQDGLLGLAHGVDLFDPTRGYRISTFLWHWCRQGVARGLHIHARTIRLPSHTEAFLHQHRKFQRQLHHTNGIQDFNRYLSIHVPSDKSSGNKVQEKLSQITAVIAPFSLDARLNEDTENELGDILADERTDGRVVMASIERQEDYDRLKEVMLQTLSDEERELVEDYYIRGIGSPTLSRKYSVSSGTIRVRLQKVMEKLRTAVMATQPVAA